MQLFSFAFCFLVFVLLIIALSVLFLVAVIRLLCIFYVVFEMSYRLILNASESSSLFPWHMACLFPLRDEKTLYIYIFLYASPFV